MSTRRSSPALVALLLAAPFTVCAAQSTNTPVFQAPYRPFEWTELGASLSEPGAGFELEGSWRMALTHTLDFGLRGGIDRGPAPDERTSLLAGGDLRLRLLTHSSSFPLDGSFTLGAGAENGNGSTVFYLPIGFSMGRRILIEGSAISLVPYVQPVATLLFGDVRGTNLSLGFGLDARITPHLDLRFSAAVGNLNGVGFTVAFLH